MNPHVLKLCEAVRVAGGRAMLVGGWVRDRLLGKESKDFDLEVYGLDPAKLRALLEQFGQVNTVGEHFSVYKLVPSIRETEASEQNRNDERVEIDVSLPRRESKSGQGHRGFVIEGDPFMTFEEAARRRDFTINAILFDPLTGQTVDPYDGQRDLSNRVLRVVAADTFVEDSLRVLRAVQLAARFEMTIDPETASLCRSIELSDLPSERIWGEVEKVLTMSNHPSIGLAAARDLGVLRRLFPELARLEEQDAGCASGNRFAHTAAALDEAASLVNDLTKPKRIAVMMATLCHDLYPSGSSNSEDQESATRAAVSILDRLGLYGLNGYDVRSQALSLVRRNRIPMEYFEHRDAITDGDFRRLSQHVEIDLLYRVSKACEKNLSGDSTAASDWFIARARSLGVEHGPPAPLLLGRHLLEAGFSPGPEMGNLLRYVYEMQLDGKITTQTEALAAARQIG